MTPLNFKKNYNKSKKSKQLKQLLDQNEPESLPHINENQSFSAIDKSSTLKPSATKMSAMQKRVSNVTNNSIWTESEDEGADDECDADDYILTKFGEIDSDTMSKASSINSPVSSRTKMASRLPAIIGKHGKNLSFASTVDLMSISGLSDDNSAQNNKSDRVLVISEHSEVEYVETPTKKEKNKKKKRSPPKIDKLLLNPRNQPSLHHSACLSSESFLSDMEFPEPTETEKLKYHLTEPRLPPQRRKTYNYSCEIPIEMD